MIDVTETTNEERDAFIASLGLEYKATFVPQSESRNAGDKQPSLNWRITLSVNRATLTTDYMQGIAHLPDYNKITNPRLVFAHEYLRRCAETGTYMRILGGRVYESIMSFAKPIAIPAPELRDVLYSLALDSEVLEYPTFEEWASSYGYDEDSRAAEKTYRACLDIALNLRAMIGDANLTRLRELFQGY